MVPYTRCCHCFWSPALGGQSTEWLDLNGGHGSRRPHRPQWCSLRRGDWWESRNLCGKLLRVAVHNDVITWMPFVEPLQLMEAWHHSASVNCPPTCTNILGPIHIMQLYSLFYPVLLWCLVHLSHISFADPGSLLQCCLEMRTL